MCVYASSQAILDIPVAEETKYKRMVVESIAPKARVRNDPPKPRIPYYRLQVNVSFYDIIGFYLHVNRYVSRVKLRVKWTRLQL